LHAGRCAILPCGRDDQCADGDFNDTVSADLRDLIRKDKDPLPLRGLLLAGVTSAPAAVADEAYVKSLRDRVGQAGLPAERN
jgi:hypothetical protein